MDMAVDGNSNNISHINSESMYISIEFENAYFGAKELVHSCIKQRKQKRKLLQNNVSSSSCEYFITTMNMKVMAVTTIHLKMRISR